MIEDTIARIEERLRSDESLPASERAELEQLLRQLRTESATLPRLDPRGPAEPGEDVHSALGRLEESLAEFEATHPQLIGIVNRISNILSNMGI
jgi:hypothetical protein